MYTVRPPQPRLRPFVKLLWATDGALPPACTEGAREHVLPTGDMHLVFRLESAPLRLFDGPGDFHGRMVGRAVVGGARSAYYIRDISTPSSSVGAWLRPGAARLLFGVDAGELAQRHTRLDDLWGRGAEIACERLVEVAGPERKLLVLESLLCQRLPRLRGLHPAVAYAIERFGLCDSVDAVVGRTGYSHRHFVSVFRDAVGLTPKTYARVVRFQNTLRSANGDRRASWADIALAGGYSDQAHFNRDFRVFTGMTPTLYREIAPASVNHVPLPGSDLFKTGRARSV